MNSHNSKDDSYAQWRNFDNLFKILIIGNSAVGKTAFLTRFTDDLFSPSFCSTIGIDFRIKTIVKGERKIKLQIWDTAGQERYRTITSAYYRGTSGFILMYDITNETSFHDVHGWCSQVKSFCYETTKAVLVGNKCDLNEERVVSYDVGYQLAEDIRLPFFEASAKENINVKSVFDFLVDIILENECLPRDEFLAEEQKKLKIEDVDDEKIQTCRC